jgi:hypothetical protein
LVYNYHSFFKLLEESKMKKIITVSLLSLALNASAGWGGNNGFNNGPWGGSNNNNGIFGNNPYSMFTPDWFSEEMDDMMDEFDSNNNGPWGNNGRNNNNPWGNNGPWNNSGPWSGGNSGPWNNSGPWGNSSPWNNSNWGNTPMGNQNGPWNNNSWKNGPWSNYGYNQPISTNSESSTGR